MVLAENPTAQTVAAGATASFTATANAASLAKVQWQSSTDGINFINVAGTSTTLLVTKAQTSKDGTLYRAVFSNSGGQVATTPVTLTVTGVPVVSLQPVAKTVPFTACRVKFEVQCHGQAAGHVQWQVSTDKSKTYAPIAGATSTTLTFRPWLAIMVTSTRPSSPNRRSSVNW